MKTANKTLASQEPKANGRARAQDLKPQLSAPLFLKRLKKEYPDAHCALVHQNAFELLIATILSAQCTDERVNQVTAHLFPKFPTAFDLAKASVNDVEKLIRSTGFFKAKTKNIIGCAQKLVDLHGGEVPQVLDDLVQLPGVGRKTANVVLGNAFGQATGVVVDTHVGRLARRFGWTQQTDPVKVESELCKLFDKKEWIMLSHYLIFHGRGPCKSLRPKCETCFLVDQCPKKGVK